MGALLPLLLMLCVGLGGLLALSWLLPMLLRVGSTLEALSILMQGLDEYFHSPWVSRSCCLIFFVAIFCACLGCLSLTLVGVHCFTSNNPIGLCRLIGR